ncbi:hypothetical protein DPMN_139560 [Dreissena polymorpha]|uniref:Uncharacterized protein n=1 Tax=Dreissena polymorpha TaxID=45954 RepID=A0A9D4G8U0_DREPO|nr:hypothetical protein DPMN_139560 [Dreissena polymorpha]
MAIQNTFLVEVCILLLECSENARCLAARGSHEEFTLGAIVAGLASRSGWRLIPTTVDVSKFIFPCRQINMN